MDSIRLANGRGTTRLAFGCGGLAGATGWRASRRILVAAWEAGIRHFDVAPSYGFGEAEVFLGRMLAEFGSEARVTTKVGISRGQRPTGFKALIHMGARVALASAPGLRRRLGDRARAAAPRGVFNSAAVRASVEQSLSALGREHIDVLLLHEAIAGDITPDLLALLEDLVCEGKIGEAGVGSRPASLSGMDWPLPAPLTVLQTEWRLPPNTVPAPGGMRVNRHGALRNVTPLTERMLAQPRLAAEIEALAGFDCRGSSGMAALLLGLAAHDAPGGQVITQSRDPARVARLADMPAIKDRETIFALLGRSI